MIIAPFHNKLLVVTQNDHAHFASELLALWRADGLPEHPRRSELLFAAREHDNDWAEFDSAPMCSAAGRPLDFMTVSPETRREIWRLGTRRHVERAPYAALLIARHAIQLHRSQRRDPDWADHFTEWDDLVAELLDKTEVEEEVVDQDYRWIELSDLLSLGVCNRWTRELECHGVSGRLHLDSNSSSDGDGPDAIPDGTLVLAPFPLAGATTFRIACRLIPDRRYAGDADLAIELATARWTHYGVRVVPSIAGAV